MFPVYPQYSFFRFLSRNIPTAQSGLIVDSPCGEGFITGWFAGAYPSMKVVGVDIDEGCIRFASGYFKNDNIDFKTQDVHDFLDAAVEIDIYLLVNSMFLLQRPKELIGKIHRKLSAGGKLGVIIPNSGSVNFRNFQVLHPGENKQVLSKEEAAAFFEGAGFRVVRTKGLGYVTIFGNTLLSRMGRLRGVCIYAGDLLNRLIGQEPSYWGFILEKV